MSVRLTTELVFKHGLLQLKYLPAGVVVLQFAFA
jgi:hypothetical protein